MSGVAPHDEAAVSAALQMCSVVEVPAGPMAGKLETLGSLLFRKTRSAWELVSFHNTRVAPGR